MKQAPAKFWKRVVAYIIDSIIISFIITSPFTSALSTKEVTNFTELFAYLQTTFSTTFLMITLVMALLTLAYWTILEWKFQQTPGKVFLKLTVISKKKPISFKQALIRNLTKLSTIILAIDCIGIIRNKKTKQRFFEKITNTQVIEEEMIL